MSTATAVIFVIAIVIVAVIALRVGGSRVKHIETRRDGEDRDDA